MIGLDSELLSSWKSCTMLLGVVSTLTPEQVGVIMVLGPVVLHLHVCHLNTLKDHLLHLGSPRSHRSWAITMTVTHDLDIVTLVTQLITGWADVFSDSDQSWTSNWTKSGMSWTNTWTGSSRSWTVATGSWSWAVH